MALYRSYEVLIEETAGNHKTRGAGKTKKDFKPHHENTCRALRVTHELFQDAVCYYILCLIGLVKDGRDKDDEPINRMWEHLHSDLMRGATHQIAAHLGKAYLKQPDLGVNPTHKLLEFVYAKTPAKKLANETVALKSIYQQLAGAAVQFKKQGKGKTAKASLADMAKFASNWYQRLANPASTQGGQEIESRNNAYWLKVAAELKSVVEPTLSPDFDDAAYAKQLKLIYCFNSPVQELSSENALKDYGLSFGVQESGGPESFWRKPLKTIGAALARYASPSDPDLLPVTFEEEVAALREFARDKKRRAQFDYPAVTSGSKPSGTYWLCLRYKFSPSPQTRRQLFENIKKRKETDSSDPLAAVRSEFAYVFPFFTNLLGLSPKSGDGAVWTGFDKSAFKRATEEVFKYRLRSDERVEQIRKRRAKIEALTGTGQWQDDKGRTKQLCGIEGDTQRPLLMRQLLDKLGGAIGYGMRRATIGGWADLRKDFLRIAKKGEPIDEDELLAAIEKSREESGGGFGSGAFFKTLCEEEYHPLWLSEWDNKQSHHPRNFVRWWVLFSEAKEELKKVWEETTGEPKPIVFTWPNTKNRHNETSFRPLDFNIPVTPTPIIALFDREGIGKPVKLVRTNAASSKKRKSAEPTDSPAFTDKDGNTLYPLTLSYRRLKRDRITNAGGNSVEAEYATPLIVGKPPKFPRKEKDKGKPLDSSASLLPVDKQGCWHFMVSFKLEREMQKQLVDEIAKIPGDKSVRIVKKNGKWVGLNLRWPIDAKTEKKKGADAALVNADGIEDTDAKFSAKKLWCSEKFEPFDILSVDLGVRYSGAWCRGRVKVGRDVDRPNQRTISPAGHAHEIVFDAYDFGTFRLQGEDAKIWRKDKHKGFGNEPELEKCGSRGRIASDAEKAEFTNLAGRVFSPTVRPPIPHEPDELKFFPDLGNHLVYRLRRRLGRIRFLFKLRWQINGAKKKVGHEYKVLDGDELKSFRGEQRFNVIAFLAFVSKDDKLEEDEDNFMRELRLKLAPDNLWSKLAYEHSGETYPLFLKVKGGRTSEEKKQSKRLKDAQKTAWVKLKQELQSDRAGEWNWDALAKTAEAELQNIMRVFAGERSLIAEVARFVWPLQDKKWKWNNCTITQDGQITQSFLERDDNSIEPKRFIHGMRGLNMKRISLMQDFRQCCQSLAKLERRFYTEDNHGLEPSPVRLGDRVHEPAQAFLDKINELRKQRVNQTAHMILAEALGLELMNPAEVTIDGKSKWELKSERDLHGRYKQKKSRVAAVVLEDLSRYRTSQDRSRYENSQLMEWSHRAIIGKLQDMAQVFGIQIITVDARFSSRFCSRTGVPGIRCAQVAKGFDNEYPWKKWKQETVGKADKDGKRQPTDRAKMILLAAGKLNLSDNSKATLVLPMDSGPAFLPVISHDPIKEGLQENADIGAAVNIGIRSVAHPDRVDIFSVFRTEAKTDGQLEIKNRRGSFSEAASKAKDRIVQVVEPPTTKKVKEKEIVSAEDDSGDDEELESVKSPYLYAAVRFGNNLSVPIDGKDRYQLPLATDGRKVAAGDSDSVGAAQGKVFWTRVKQDCWTRIKKINAERLRNLGIEPPCEWNV
ncbi:MAG: type V CRISPR-associated protein Cas12b [Candidatus Omnitrophota bacterium]|nr:type V CRISPR-associated protein Cas12b [Candidatus Omnitrophota bacterium]